MKNRKTNLTKLFKIGLLFFSICFLLISCEKDEFITITSSPENKINFSEKSFNDIQKSTKFKDAFKKVFETKKQYLKSHNRIKTAIEVDNDFIIDTNAVSVVSSDKHTSYTMLIHRKVEDETFYENLVIQIDSLNSTKAYILKYQLKSQLIPHEEHHSYEQDTEITVTPIVYDNTQSKMIEECRTVMVTYCPYKFEHVAGPSCFNHPDRLYQKPKKECISYDDGSDNDGPGGGETGGGSTGVGGGSSTSIYTTPIISNTNPARFYEKIFSFQEAIDFVPPRYSSVETQFSYLGAVGKFLKQTSFYELGDVLFDLSINQTTLNESEAALMTSKTVEILNLIKNVSSFDQLSLNNQKIVATNSLFISFLPEVNSIIGQYWPKNEEEWKVIGAIFEQFLPELALGFIPGSDIVEVVRGINNGDTIAVAFGIAGVIVDAFGGTILKGLTKAGRIAYKVFKSFKLAYKFVKVIGKALKSGLKIALDNRVVKFLNNSGSEVARIVNNVMTFKYTGFGGNIVTNPNKTTTVIGKWQNQIENIWNTGLAKQGVNNGGMNILGNVPNGSILEKWNFNKEWLNQAIARGDAIRVTANPLDIKNVFNTLSGINSSAFSNINYLKSYLLSLSPDKVNQLGFYGREIRHLFLNGYIFNSVTNQFIK